MADRKYTFPEGISSIDQKDLHEAFCNYEIVEIPGSVANVKTFWYIFGKDPRKQVLKRLILNEGTVSLYAKMERRFEYNIPSTLIQIECTGMVQRVLCLKNGFMKAHFSNFDEVEYLQTYTSADMRYASLKHLKHYVYLGEKMRNWSTATPFEGVPSGCVFHVENETMAKSVLKKCDVLNHYVVVDAAEWKDFPADKLALSMEEYNPESRILPEQIKMREKKKKQQKEEEEKKRAKERQRNKEELIKEMSEQMILPKLEALLGPNKKFDQNHWRYFVQTEENEQTGKNLLCVTVVMEHVLRYGDNKEHLCIRAMINTKNVESQTDALCNHIVSLQKFLDENIEMINLYKMKFPTHYYGSYPNCPDLGISFPYMNKRIVATFRRETIAEDCKAIQAIVDGLNDLANKGSEELYLGFSIVNFR